MAYSDVILASGPTAYWRMDDYASSVMLDSSGNGNHGSYAGAVVRYSTGAFTSLPNNAVYFPGVTSAYATIPNSTVLNPGAGEYAIEFWLTTNQQNISIPFGKYITSPPYDGPTFITNYSLSDSNVPGVFQYRERDASGYRVVSTSTNLSTAGGWRHYVLQRRMISSGTYALEMYINGVLEGSTTLPAVIDHTSNTTAFWLGTANGANPFNGTMDEVAYYVGKSLSATDILAHYNANVRSYSSNSLPGNQSVYTGSPKYGNGYGLQLTKMNRNSFKYKTLDSNYQSPFISLIDNSVTSNFMSGTTIFQGAPLPYTKVNLYDRRTGELLRSAVTDVNGAWQFLDLIGTAGYYAVAVDPDGFPLYNSIINDKLAPVPYTIALGGEFILNPDTGTMDGAGTIDSGMPPFTIDLIDGATPAGLTLGVSPDNRKIVASGTSSFYQDYYFTVKVSNGQGYVAQKAYQALLPTSFGKAQGYEGQKFNLIFAFDTDIYFNAVSSRMTMDTLTDTVKPSMVWTPHGATTIQTAIKRYGSSSLYCPVDSNNGGGISTPYNSALDISDVNDWTVECWVYVTDAFTSGNSRVIFTTEYNNNNIPVAIGCGNETATSNDPGCPWVGFYNYPTAWYKIFATKPVPLTTWTHLAFTKIGNVYSIFMNGVLTGRGTITTAVGAADVGKSFYIGRRWDASSGLTPYNFGGYIDDFRITKGVARYNTNFDLPAVANPAASPEDRDMYWDALGTQLTFEDGLMTDDTGHLIWGLSGSTSVTGTDAAVGNNSLLFDGNMSGYASIAANSVPMQVENDPFTVDLWFKVDGPLSDSSGGYGYTLFAQNNPSGAGEQFANINADGSILFQRNSSFSNSFLITSSAGLITSNIWHHYALVYDGSTMRQFVDGVLAGSSPATKGWTITTELFKLGNCLVPGYSQYQRSFKGKIDNFRITRGIARWTDTFNPPTTLSTVFDPDDTNHHIERMVAQPLKNLSTNTFNDISIRLGSPTFTWFPSDSNSYLRLSNTSGTTGFISFDRWGAFSGNYYFEIDVDYVSDNLSRKHFGLYLDSGSSGSNGYRFSHLDNSFVISKWTAGVETITTPVIPDSVYPVTAGNRYTMRVEIVGNKMTFFWNGLYAATMTDSTFSGLRPGIHLYGGVINIRRIETGTLVLPASQTVYTPPLGYNVAFGRKAFLEDQTRGQQIIGTNPSGYWEIVDNNMSPSYYFTVSTPSSPAVLIVDLETPQTINQVKVWHYWNDARVYSNTKTEISLDGSSWTTIFDSAVSGTYTEVVGGHIINFASTPVRYIRDTCGSSNVNANAHWTEIQASLN